MPTSAPRISPRLLDALVRFDDGKLPISDIHRRVGSEADRLRLTRPSYQRTRELVQQSRRLRGRGPSTTEVLLHVMTRARPPSAVVDHVAGICLPKL